MADSYAARWDARPIEAETDYGWIGEDTGGLWIKVHPQVAFLRFPEIWNIVSRVTTGDSEMKPSDYDTLSAFEFEAKLTMVQAINRKWQPKDPEEEDHDG